MEILSWVTAYLMTGLVLHGNLRMADKAIDPGGRGLQPLVSAVMWPVILLLTILAGLCSE